jgi:hypothetical protein
MKQYIKDVPKDNEIGSVLYKTIHQPHFISTYRAVNINQAEHLDSIFRGSDTLNLTYPFQIINRISKIQMRRDNTN